MILDDSDPAKYSFVDINETENEVTDSGQHFDRTLTLNGGLEIHDIVKEDYDTYLCVASNGFLSTNESVIFRVRGEFALLSLYHDCCFVSH